MPPSWKKRKKAQNNNIEQIKDNLINENSYLVDNLQNNKPDSIQSDDSLEKVKEFLERAEIEGTGYERKREISKKEKMFKKLEKAAIWFVKTKLKFQGNDKIKDDKKIEKMDPHEIIDAAHELQPEISYEDLKKYYSTLENGTNGTEESKKIELNEEKLKILEEIDKKEKEKFRRLISCIFSRSHLEEFLSVMEALGFKDLGGFEYLGRRDADYSLAMDWEIKYRLHARVYLVKEEVFVLVHHEPKATEDVSLHIKGYFDRITNALLEKEKYKQLGKKGLNDDDGKEDELDIESGSNGEEKVELSNYELGTDIFLKLLKKRVPNFYKKLKTKIEDQDLAIWRKFIGVIDHLSPEELLKENLYESSRYIPPFIQVRDTAKKMFTYFQLDTIPAWDDDVPASDKYFIATNESPAFSDVGNAVDECLDSFNSNDSINKGFTSRLMLRGRELSRKILRRKWIRRSKLSEIGLLKPADQLSILVLTEDISEQILRTIGTLKTKYKPDYIVFIAPDISLFGPEEDDIPPEGIEIPPFNKSRTDELVNFLTDSGVTIIPVSLFIKLFDMNLKTPLNYSHLKLLFSNKGLLSENHIQEISNKFDYIDDYIKNAEKMLEVIKALPKYRWVSFRKLKKHLKKEGLGLSPPELLGLLGIMESPIINLIESQRVSWIRYRTRARITDDEWFEKKEQLKHLLQNFLIDAL